VLDVSVRYANFFTALKRPGTGVCHCWRVTRLDGEAYLFTDHDEEITVAVTGGDPSGSPTPDDLLTFSPIDSFAVTATKKEQGLAVDNLSIIGLIDDGGSPSRISERDILADLFADATVEIWLCCWTDLDAGLMPLKSGTLGTMVFRTTGFEAEMRGLAERLQRQVHRVFAIECDAVLGDARCGVDLGGGSPNFRRSVTVQSVTDNRVFTVDLLEEEQWAQYGLASFTSGENTGLAREIIDHVSSTGSPTTGAEITLLIPMPFDIQVGDALTVTTGCDKTAATCKAKFGNLINFRGFHLIPTQEQANEFPDAK